MIRSVDFLSLEDARGLRPRYDTLLISILDQAELSRHGRPRLGGWRSVLALDFEDVCEEAKLAAPGSWPDEPTREQHARFCHDPWEAAPTLADARRIVEFVMGHHALDENLPLLVHCFAGVSRSGAVAHWVHQRLGVPRGPQGTAKIEFANARVLRLLDKAHEQYLQALQAEMGEGAPQAAGTLPRDRHG